MLPSNSEYCTSGLDSGTMHPVRRWLYARSKAHAILGGERTTKSVSTAGERCEMSKLTDRTLLEANHIAMYASAQS